MEHFSIKLLNLTLDTFNFSIRLEHRTGDYTTVRSSEYNLDNLMKKENIDPHDRHTAVGDAFMTAQLALKLIKRAEKNGITTLGQLLRNHVF